MLNRGGQFQPQGLKGDLYISGVGLARGYLNSPELTGDKFENNLFLEGERVYRTGDLARWMSGSDGNLEFLGRIDHQVKVRGFRIELGEIENQLLEIDYIREAVVIDREEDIDKYLCAYIVSDIEIDISEIRNLLSDKLPDHMIPSYFVQIEELPLTPNGKLDRKVLPDPEIKVGDIYVQPYHPTTKEIVNITSAKK